MLARKSLKSSWETRSKSMQEPGHTLANLGDMFFLCFFFVNG